MSAVHTQVVVGHGLFWVHPDGLLEPDLCLLQTAQSEVGGGQVVESLVVHLRKLHCLFKAAASHRQTKVSWGELDSLSKLTRPELLCSFSRLIEGFPC